MALLLGIGLLAMQTASAATLTLDNPTNGVTVGSDGTGSTPSFGGAFNVIIDADPGELVNLLFSFNFTGANGGFEFADGLDPVGLSAGVYRLDVFGPSNFTVSFTDSVGEVPVPAAVWLFGSALMGLFGVSRRKSSSALAA